jgi:hypothetical protein
MSEWWYFKTARWGAPLAGPITVASGSLLWMTLQWGFYVKGGGTEGVGKSSGNRRDETGEKTVRE